MLCWRWKEGGERSDSGVYVQSKVALASKRSSLTVGEVGRHFSGNQDATYSLIEDPGARIC